MESVPHYKTIQLMIMILSIIEENKDALNVKMDIQDYSLKKMITIVLYPIIRKILHLQRLFMFKIVNSTIIVIKKIPLIHWFVKNVNRIICWQLPTHVFKLQIIYNIVLSHKVQPDVLLVNQVII